LLYKETRAWFFSNFSQPDIPELTAPTFARSVSKNLPHCVHSYSSPQRGKGEFTVFNSKKEKIRLQIYKTIDN
jgi:hypothetical protein